MSDKAIEALIPHAMKPCNISKVKTAQTSDAVIKTNYNLTCDGSACSFFVAESTYDTTWNFLGTLIFTIPTTHFKLHRIWENDSGEIKGLTCSSSENTGTECKVSNSICEFRVDLCGLKAGNINDTDSQQTKDLEFLLFHYLPLKLAWKEDDDMIMLFEYSGLSNGAIESLKTLLSEQN